MPGLMMDFPGADKLSARTGRVGKSRARYAFELAC